MKIKEVDQDWPQMRLDLKEYALKLKSAGIKYKFSDYNLSLIALIEEDRAICICKQYRPERDGYSGMKIISDEIFKELLKKYRGEHV